MLHRSESSRNGSHGKSVQGSQGRLGVERHYDRGFHCGDGWVEARLEYSGFLIHRHLRITVRLRSSPRTPRPSPVAGSVLLTLRNDDQSSCASGSNLYVPIGLCRAYADRTDDLAIDGQWQSAGHLHKA